VYITLALTLFGAAAFGWLNRWLGAVGIAIFLAGAFLMLRRPAGTFLATVKAAVQHRRATSNRPAWKRRLIIGVPVIIVLGAVVPWQISVVAPFQVAPVLSTPQAAPDSGYIEGVLVREGGRVMTGSPLLRIRNLALERELVSARRSSDSLAVLAAQARGMDRRAALAMLTAHQAAEDARVDGLERRVEALRIRALSSGTVLTPRPEELEGRWVSNGHVVILLGKEDSVEIRISLSGAGGALVRRGSPVNLLFEADRAVPVHDSVTAVSVAAPASAPEARLRLPAAGGRRPGMTGHASVVVRRSNVWGVLWWRLRRGVRTDILL
jgi:hypothetical protein